VAYAYDAAGRRASMTDGTGATAYAYDELDRLSSVTLPGGRVVRYEYDPAGHRSRLVYPDGKAVGYAYDDAGRLSGVTDWLGQATAYAHDAAGRLTATTYPTGVVETRAYTGADQLLSLSAAKTGTTLTSFAYTLDDAGHRAAVQTPAGPEAYAYDALYRLTGVAYADGTTQAYTYDAVGNRLTEAQGGATTSYATTSYAYDAADRLTSVTAGAATAYAWDANGNQTGRGGDAFTWDAEDRLTGATGGGASASYAYRGDGLRHSKTVAGATTAYTWDVAAAPPVVLQDGQDTYVYGLGGRLVSQTDAAGAQTYFLNDGLGSTAALTDGSGAVRATLAYDAFGAVRATSGAAATEYRFTGQQDDAALGYAYLRARYYDPAPGRFLSKDPLRGSAARPASQHPYGYAFSDPVNAADPTGQAGEALAPEIAGVAAVCAVQPELCVLAGGAALVGTTAVWWANGGQEQVANLCTATSGAASAGLSGLNTLLAKGRTLTPGPYAGDSIPARGPGREWTAEEQETIDQIGQQTGCHTCGTTDPGTKSGHFIPDHQPPSALNPDGDPQRLYPQCLSCSRVQGGEVRTAQREMAGETELP
jgi:RHS repeat-associated protein